MALNDVSEKYKTSLASVIGERVTLEDPQALDMLSEIAEEVANSKGTKQAFEDLLGSTANVFLASLRVPDWALLYFKLESRIPDESWVL